MARLCTENKNILAGIVTSKMRVRILVRLFLNPQNRTYLREMAVEFGASPGQLREELKQLADADLLKLERVGRKVFYQANEQHELFPELSSIVRKALGIDKILDNIARRLRDVQRMAVIDDYATGKDTGIIDIVLLGNIDRLRLSHLSKETEKQIGRKIRPLVYDLDDIDQFQSLLDARPSIEIWNQRSHR